MTFKPGDVVEVVNEKDFWLGALGNTVAQFVVKKVHWSRLPCCAGHAQSLEFVNGDYASGAWFDPDLIGKPKVWCSRSHHEHESYSIQDAEEETTHA